MLWSKYTKSGRSWTLFHSIGSSSRKLARTGSSIGLSFQISMWQPMHTSVAGMFAEAARSTVVWQ